MTSLRRFVVFGLMSVAVAFAIACTGEDPLPLTQGPAEDGSLPPDEAETDGNAPDAGEDAPSTSSRVVALAAGQAHACAARADGTVICWGDNNGGQLGTPADKARPLLDVVPDLTSVKSVCAGLFFTCAVQEGGAVLCWGSAADGRIGQDPATVTGVCEGFPCTPKPTVVSGLPPAEQIACGLSTACARTPGGDVYCWGANSGTVLGLPVATTSTHTPNKIALGAKAVDLSIGMAGGNRVHACVATATGEARCWGYNSHNDLGVTDAGLTPCYGSGYCATTPVIARTTADIALDEVTSVRVGLDHSCALRSDGTVWCWGANYGGALGRGIATDTAAYLAGPTKAFPSRIRAIEAHHDVLQAVDSTKRIWSWGNGMFGAIGDGSPKADTCANGTDTCRAAPVRLAIPSDVQAVATGVQFTVALTGRGELWSWGVNRGELGHRPGEQGDQNCETYACNPSPTKVPLP